LLAHILYTHTRLRPCALPPILGSKIRIRGTLSPLLIGMSSPAPRLHRLPQRLDYTLIPAPLDLSLPLATEKSSLPAIIVTPSSPSSSRDFSIAFLAPPPKPSFAERLSTFTSFQAPVHLKARTFIIVFLILFILMCHVVTHLAAQRPHLEFPAEIQEAHTTTWFAWFRVRLAEFLTTDTKQVPSVVNVTS